MSHSHRKDFILADPQVVSCPTIFAKGVTIKLVVRCHTCNELVNICLIPYWKRRRHGPWSCHKCLKPKLVEASKNLPIFADPEYRDKFRKLHDDPDYHAAVHNAATNAKISQSAKEAWQDPQKRASHLQHRKTAESRRAIGERARITNLQRSAANQQFRLDHFIAKTSTLYDGKYDYSSADYTNAKGSITVACTACGHKFERVPMAHLRGRCLCPSCNISNGQREISEFIKTITPCDLNDRKTLAPCEIDIYLPEHKIGVEYHGLYWHSYNRLETSRERLRHQTKFLLAANAGVRLLQFCDFEWRDKPDIVKSMIGHRLRQSNPFDARKLTIASITNKAARGFFAANHIAGHRDAKFLFGLGNAELLMAISFNRQADGQLEIIRMATKLGCHVRGGASKLLSHAIKTLKPRAVVTFADLRHSNGSGYKRLGFVELHISHPNYLYYRKGIRQSRYRCQKHKLGSLLEDFNPEASEAINMFNNGYRRFWDAGNMKLILKP